MKYCFRRIIFPYKNLISVEVLLVAAVVCLSLFTILMIVPSVDGMGKPDTPPGGGGGSNGGGGGSNGGGGGGTTLSDADFDGMEDTWESANRLDPSDPSDAIGDLDGDYFTNYQEFWMGTNPDGIREPGVFHVDAAVNAGGDGTYGSPFKTIQEAIKGLSDIDDALPTDKIAILVKPGEYKEENIVSSKPYVHIVSTDGPSVTKIIGSPSSTVVTLHDFITATISGFAIQGGIGGLYLDSSEGVALIDGNFIIDNNSTGNGGGIFVSTADSTRIINNFIVGNNAVQGGGVYFDAGKVSFWHNTVVKNHASDNGGGLAASAVKLKPDAQNNIVWGNHSEGNSPQVYRVNPSFSIVQGGAGGTGNIDSDPMFVDEDNENYHICANSPARDAAAQVTLAYDVDQEIRENSFIAGDIGADEAANPVSPHGLKGDYLLGNIFSAAEPADVPQTMTRIDSVVDFDWGEQSPDISPAANLPQDDFSVRWTGHLQAPATGGFVFVTEADSSTTLIIDGKKISNGGTINLSQGQKYEIVMEYYHKTGSSFVRLFWQKPGDENSEIVPNRALLSPIPDFRYPLYTPTTTSQGISISSDNDPLKTQIYNEGDDIKIVNNHLQDGQTEVMRVFSRSGCIYHSEETPKEIILSNLSADHYFVEIESGDRRQFVVLPADYEGADFLGTEEPQTPFRLRLVNAIKPGHIRIHTKGQWGFLQPSEGPLNTANLAVLDGIIKGINGSAALDAPIITISCFGRPKWQMDDEAFLSDYTNYLKKLADWLKTEYSSDFMFEIWNEPATATPPFITGSPDSDTSYVSMVKAAHEKILSEEYPSIRFRSHEADNFASSFARKDPYGYEINTGGDFRYLQENGVYALSSVRAVSWHPTSMARWPVDEDSFNEDGVLIHQLDKQGPALRLLGIKNLTEDPDQGAELHVSEMYLWSESALGFPIKLPQDRAEDNLDWVTGMNRGVKEVILWRAGGVDLISPHVFTEAFSPNPFEKPENGNDNRNGWDYYFRGPHPKTGAFLMASYWLNGAEFLSSSVTETIRIYTFSKNGETFHFAWAKEGQTIPRDSSLSPLTATDIFGRPVPAIDHTDEVYLFR